MDTWQDDYPFAYHVFPLHLARDIWRAGALLSKKERGACGSHVARPTTAAVDEALGFDDVVHLYLPKRGTPITALPILDAQLRPSQVPPFPHAVLRVPTHALGPDALLCCWNIAVSRPKSAAAGVKGGNWARGTPAARIAGVWDAFRGEEPEFERARGRWVVARKVPVLLATDVPSHRGLLQRPRGGPELLIRDRLPVRSPMSVIVFGERDRGLLERPGPAPGGIQIEVRRFPGYGAEAASTVEAYARIERHLQGEQVGDLDFDRVRPGVASKLS
jgi:hypothetical protein